MASILIDTLPTHLQTTTKDPLIGELQSTTTNPPTISIVPPDEPTSHDTDGGGSDITFDESGHEKTFLFAKNNTFIQMDGELISTFQLRYVQFSSLRF